MYKFLKLHSCGNDFLIFFKKVNDFLISKFINKKSGITCDQILIIKKIILDKNIIKIEIINNNLSRANNCGNGIRSLSWFFLKKKKTNSIIKFPVKNNFILSYKNKKKNIISFFKIPNFFKKIILRIEFYFLKSGFVELNNLHFITIIKNIKTYYLFFFYNKINFFFNNIVNIEFIQIVKNNEFYIRIFEKGVGETYSCGTGIISSCYYINNINKKINLFNVYSLGGFSKISFFDKFIILTNKINFCCFGYL
ncbi:diaminopimelate epimerase [Candidatus Carsonella ruddii PV]|uniref:Diaminopimelate epimerase n=1 Tax=Carsonella ruddii (strain PV) TaxID=387662 RepID=Q05FG2_CARRP|nr:diaminopimelate epimerase [Candidatus Carsonella ruddii]BAF35209.1 diaminopimelate epimerase [Candidatus Carsonella ruddii PV]